MMQNKIIILDDISFVRRNFEEISKIVETEKSSVLPLSDAVYLFLRAKDIDCLDIHDFEYTGIYDDIYPVARNWGINWYRPDGADISERNSYSLGNLIEWSMIYFFAHFLRLYLDLSEAIKSIKPSQIIFIGSGDFDLKRNPIKLQNVDIELLGYMLDELIRNKGLAIELKHVKLHYPNGIEDRNFSVVRTACAHLNSFLWKLILLSKKPFGRHKKILFFEGAHHFFNIMKSAALKRCEKVHFEKELGLSLFIKFSINGIRIRLLERKDKVSFAGVFNTDNIKNRLANSFIYRGGNLSYLVWPRLKYIFTDYFPNIVLPDLMSAIRALEKESPDLVVTENDTTYFERMVVVIAERMKILTVVIQHGATICEDACQNQGIMYHDFYPLTSDKFFAFGETTKSWFMRMRENEKKIVVTGGARFDDYYKKRDALRASGNKNVLIIINDIWLKEGVVTHNVGLGVFYNHILKFFKLAEKNPDINFIIRPHDNTNMWKEVFKGRFDGLTNFVISREKSLQEIFLSTDLTIGYTSTALLEALIFKIPLVSINTGEFYNFLPLWKYNLSYEIKKLEDLEDKIKELIYDTDEIKKCRENIEENLYLFNYNNDGLASGRIADRLCDTVENSTNERI